MSKGQASVIIVLLTLILAVQSVFTFKSVFEKPREYKYEIVNIARRERDDPPEWEGGYYSHECASLFNELGIEFVGVVSKNGANGSYVLIRKPKSVK